MKLAPWYYRLREQLGFPGISAERKRRQMVLHPEEEALPALQAEDEKRLRLALGCVAAGLLLAGIAAVARREVQISSLIRPEVGEDAEELTLSARLGQEPYEVPVTLEARLYTAEEWMEIREIVWDRLREQALGENDSWDNIRRDLVLSEETGEPGITVSWESSDPDWIDFDGSLGELTAEQDGAQVILKALIQCEEECYEPQVTAVLRVAPGTLQERNRGELAEQLKEAAADREQQEVLLPQEFHGQSLRFLKEENSSSGLILLLALLAAAAFWFLPEQRCQEAEKERRIQLEAAYPELISSLTVLMGAGLPIRSAWERIVFSYRRRLLNGGERHPLYEEMSLAVNSLGQGSLEEEVYIRFGKRCGLQPYLRLGSLLESNLKKGSKGLLPLLKEEAENALEERLRGARKQGEEISSRLLLPMLLLFSLVMVILMVPAFLSF